MPVIKPDKIDDHDLTVREDGGHDTAGLRRHDRWFGRGFNHDVSVISSGREVLCTGLKWFFYLFGW
jgi:hypothetical protein